MWQRTGGTASIPVPANDAAVRVLEGTATPQQDNAPDKERPMRRQGKTADEHYKQFADDIITQIERGTAPWQKHWQPGENRMPENFSTGARYQGGNALQLMVKRTQRAYNDNRWGTYKQIKEAKGQVRKGERGTTVLVYKPAERADRKEATSEDKSEQKLKNPDAEPTTRPMWRRYTVFNVEQADGPQTPRTGGGDSRMGGATERGESHPGSWGADPGSQRGPRLLQHAPRRNRVARAVPIQERGRLLPDRAP